MHADDTARGRPYARVEPSSEERARILRLRTQPAAWSPYRIAAETGWGIGHVLRIIAEAGLSSVDPAARRRAGRRPQARA
jgi:hypothetical protein